MENRLKVCLMKGTVGSVRRLSSSESDGLVGLITFASSTAKLRWSETELDYLLFVVSSRGLFQFDFV